MTTRRCVSVVTVTYQSRQHIALCLSSIASTAPEWTTDCTVVDNASTDGTAEYVRREFGWVSVIESSQNLGYGRAINLAAKRAAGQYLLILNPDVVLRPQAVAELVRFMDHRPEAAACGQMLLSPAGRFRYESRRGFPTPWNAMGYMLGLGKLLPQSRLFGGYHSRWLSPNLEIATDSLSGSCMMVRRERFEQVGGFDEDYFLFGEDIDLCWKLKRAHHEIWYVPSAIVVHAKGASMLHARKTARREFYRSMRIFINKRLVSIYPRPLIWATRMGIGVAELFNLKYRR
ncbi:glycosyltransferase family 2 protein [bacterium]|nr:glycosyltransferase family 2 protein [bacterium]